jgi:N-methylhydantoinase A/oxoprolinase/acetone carboxylase beta subunit
VAERCGPDGVLRPDPLDDAEVCALVRELAGIDDLQAVAVCFLFSFAQPEA